MANADALVDVLFGNHSADEVIRRKNPVQECRSLDVKIGEESARITTLYGTRAEFGIDEASRKILDDTGFRELPFAAYHAFDNKQRKLLGDKASLAVSQMIRRDNSTQRKQADALFKGKLQIRNVHDPRPLSQQFSEMNPDQMIDKMIQLELQERIGTYAPRGTTAAYTPTQQRLQLRQQKEIKAPNLHFLLHKRKSQPVQPVTKRPQSASLVLPYGKSKQTKRMTAEERALRLLTPQAKEFQRLRSGLEEYDANVEASVAAVGAATRAAAVQSNKDKMVRIKQLEAQRKALCLARPKSAMYHLPCSMADLARAAAATSAASDVSSLSSSFAALRPRSSKSAHKHPILLMQNYTPEPISMDNERILLKKAKGEVRDMMQASRRKSVEWNMFSEGRSGGLNDESETKSVDSNSQHRRVHVDYDKPVLLEGDRGFEEFEFAEVFK
jgi:hypothetical protein|uniref:Uncharacterized protein n=1 Tax=Eutreptiella gymnastica TaxID=73025 RepID=A0A7S4CU85_9EUGL